MQNAEWRMQIGGCRVPPFTLYTLHSTFCITAAAILAAGCTPRYRPNIRLADSVVRPPRSVLLITVDGLSEPVLDQMLAEGALPHIAALIEQGVRPRAASDSLPSLTYPNLTTLLTGQAPSRHGILGNKWFDRSALVYRNYATMADYRLADDDFTAPTIFEYLGDEFSVSVQCAVRRGAGRIIDNWATSGIRWFFGGYEAVDQLMPFRFDIIAEEANRRGQWPTLIHAYFPGVDEVGHVCGPDSARYRAALVNVDRQIGMMEEAVTQAGMAEYTCTILTSDHNHMPIPGKNWFDVAEWLRRNAGLRVLTEPPPDEPWEARRKRYENTDAVVVIGGDRIAGIHLRGPGGWHDRPTAEQIAAVIRAGCSDEASPLSEQGGAMACAGRCPDGERIVFLRSRERDWNLARRSGQQIHHGLKPWTCLAVEPLCNTVPARIRMDGSDAWTEETEATRLFEEIERLFESARAGDIVLFAADGWDFVPGGAGGHGGLGDKDTRVPMIFSGAMMDRSTVIEKARLVDVAPTILGLLGKLPTSAETVFDGRDLSKALVPG